jgi:UDP-N-acetylmuramoyl-L-alanyl-D-glutamate--2,6-diaminopimelate ligase
VKDQPPVTHEQAGPADHQDEPTAPLRPRHNTPVRLAEIAALAGAAMSSAVDGPEPLLSGVSLDSRAIVPGDLYLALPGAQRHGAEFAAQAVAAGAVAILTDDAGAALAGNAGVAVLTVARPRAVVGAVAARIYGTDSTAADRASMPLFAVTGTNGKTTTTYFLNSLLRALGRTTGLIGTIEILAGDAAIPSKLTTPESTDVHALLAVMAERGLGAASMEVSSHALAFGRVDSVLFDVSGFTNLTQDHLDLHGSMEDYFATKAALFGADRSRRAVITVDDPWGVQMAGASEVPTATLATAENTDTAADWQVHDVSREGVGSRFTLTGPDGARLSVHTGLPGDFNIANAALAAVMLIEQLSAAGPLAGAVARVQAALDAHDPFTVDVPGRMQLVGTAPTAIVDFAHNPDALERALTAVRPEAGGAKVIVVFGATGQRDAGKRPIMGAVAANFADVVIITDDDPHDEDPAAIRAGVLAGALEANETLGLSRVIEEVGNRADAIVRAVELAGPLDTILVAGRGHEVYQEVKGVNLALDDRVELRAALARFGFTATSATTIES